MDAFIRYGAAAGSGATPTRVAIYGDMGNSEFNNMGNLAAGKGATTACPFCLNLLKCTLAGRLGVHPPPAPISVFCSRETAACIIWVVLTL